MNMKTGFIVLMLSALVAIAYYVINTDNYNKVQKIIQSISYKNHTIKFSSEYKTKNLPLHLTHDFQTFNESEYFKKLFNYLSMWKNGLYNRKSQFSIHLELLNYTNYLLVEEQNLPKLNVTERPVPLSRLLNCGNPEYSSFLTSTQRNNQSKIIDFIVFGYEIVLVEIRLYELYDTVDEFIIFETNLTFKRVNKPLFFFNNIHRFQRFLDKITLVTPFNITRFNKADVTISSKIDIADADIPVEYKRSQLPDEKLNDPSFFKMDFSIEHSVRILPIRLYTKYVRQIEANEIIIHGDVDEIPNSNIIYHFKHCDVKEELYPFSAWSIFYIYNFNNLFQSDYPAGDLFSLRYPALMLYEHINRENTARQGSKNFLPHASGCHCSTFSSGFMMGLYKSMSQSDSVGLGIQFIEVIKAGTIESVKHLKSLYRDGIVFDYFNARIRKLKTFQANEKFFVPWIVESNKNVYKDYT